MSNKLSPDMVDFIELLQKYEVEFLICGGHAVGFHGYVRMTLDFDIMTKPNLENAQKLVDAFDAFGLKNMPVKPFSEPGAVFSFGAVPNQIDILTSVSSQDSEEIFKNCVKGSLGQFDLNFISLGDLLRAKIEVNRPKDQVDVLELKAINKL